MKTYHQFFKSVYLSTSFRSVIKLSKYKRKDLVRMSEHTIIENRNDKHHERRKVKFPDESQQHESQLRHH